MTCLELAALLLAAGLAGALGQAIAGHSRGGCLVLIALGFVGALLGSWVAGQLGLLELLVISIGDRPFPVVWAVIGAAIFVGVLGLPARSRRPV